MKRFYALEYKKGIVSPYSSLYKPTLHVFYSIKERDCFCNDFPCDFEHYCSPAPSSLVYSAYTRILDGIRTYTGPVIFHSTSCTYSF